MLHHQGMPGQRTFSQHKPSQRTNLYFYESVVFPVIIIVTMMLGSCYAEDPVLVSAKHITMY